MAAPRRILPWEKAKKPKRAPRAPRAPTGPRYEGLVWEGPIEDGFEEVKLRENHFKYTYVELRNLVRSLGLRGFSKYTDSASLYPALKDWLVNQEKYYLVKEGKPRVLPNVADLVGGVLYTGYGLMPHPASPDQLAEVVDLEFKDPVAEGKAAKAAKPRVSVHEKAARRRRAAQLFNMRGRRVSGMSGRKPKVRNPVVKDEEGWIDTGTGKGKAPRRKSPPPPAPREGAWAIDTQMLGGDGDGDLPSPKAAKSPRAARERSPSPSRSPSPAKEKTKPLPSRSPPPEPERKPAKRKRGRSREEKRRHKHEKRRERRRKERSESPATPRMRRPGSGVKPVTLDSFAIEIFRHEVGRVHGSERRRLRDLKSLIEEYILVEKA